MRCQKKILRDYEKLVFGTSVVLLYSESHFAITTRFPKTKFAAQLHNNMEMQFWRFFVYVSLINWDNQQIQHLGVHLFAIRFSIENGRTIQNKQMKIAQWIRRQLKRFQQNKWAKRVLGGKCEGRLRSLGAAHRPIEFSVKSHYCGKKALISISTHAWTFQEMMIFMSKNIHYLRSVSSKPRFWFLRGIHQWWCEGRSWGLLRSQDQARPLRVTSIISDSEHVGKMVLEWKNRTFFPLSTLLAFNHTSW